MAQDDKPAQIFENNKLNIQDDVKYVPGEILVKFNPGVSDDKIANINSRHGASVAYTSSHAGFKILKVPKSKTVEEMVEIYSKNPNVEYAEPNFIASASFVPNDPYYGLQWHLDNPGYGGINMEEAWDINRGGNPSVVVAVLDTGVAYENHYDSNKGQWYYLAPDLANTAFVPGRDFVNDDNHPNDDNSHGTHVAGTIAQSTNNNKGIAGVAYGCSIMPVKVVNSAGSGSYSDIAEGIIWAADNGAQVISMSLSGPSPSSTLEAAVRDAHDIYGVTIVCAAGNYYEVGNEPRYPAAYDAYCIAVGATRYDETRAYYSNTGDYLDIVAPGGDLTVNQNGDSYGDGVLQNTFKPANYPYPGAPADPADFGYWFFEGTSMATPHVSGVAALLIAEGVATTPGEVRAALETTAKDLGAPGRDDVYGHGLVDAHAALQWTAVPPVPPEAEFEGSPTSGDAPLTVEFTDLSTDAISWQWDFGDGGSSTDQSPSHTYLNAGVYTVELTVTGPGGDDTETKIDYIQVTAPPVPTADFTGNPTTGQAPLNVEFTDKSPGEITSWSWNFGDGGSSTDQSPSHTYLDAGDYTVKLTVTGPGGDDTEIKTNYIHVDPTPAPIADFTGSPTSGDAPLTVEFTDLSTDATSWQWDFGDGGSSTDQSPSHTYLNAGDYTVKLTVTGPGGDDTEIKTNYIHVDPSAKIEVFYDSFEEGEWNGLWTEDSQRDWYDSAQRKIDGRYSAEIDGRATDATLTSIPINLQGRTSATITFSWFIERTLDSGEYLAFDVYDGTSWQEVRTLRGNVDQENVWHEESIDVTNMDPDNFKIRFRGKMSRSNEDANVDKVKVIAR